MGGVDIGRRRAATPLWPGLVPVRAGLVIDFCTSPVRTGNSTYLCVSYLRAEVNASIAICWDSQAALKALAAAKTTSKLVLETMKALT